MGGQVVKMSSDGQFLESFEIPGIAVTNLTFYPDDSSMYVAAVEDVTGMHRSIGSIWKIDLRPSIRGSEHDHDSRQESLLSYSDWLCCCGMVTACGPRVRRLAADVKVLKMATDSGAKGSPSGNALLRWAELIETGTNGEIDVKVFYQSELGGPQDVFDLYIANDINLTLNWPMTSYDPRIAVIYTPYMFTRLG